MTRILLFIAFAVSSLIDANASSNLHKYNNDSLITVLDAVINNKNFYEHKKRLSIERHLYRFNNATTDKDLYHECNTLLELYKKYRLDSVLYYASKKLEIAQRRLDCTLDDEYG